MDRAERQRWRAAGFTDAEAEVWCRWHITLDTALAWRAAGVPEGLPAAQWTVAGVTPDTVGAWRGAGVDAVEAIHCREMGYDLAAARELKRRGLSAEQAYGQGLRATGPAGGLAASPTHPDEAAYRRFQAAGVPPMMVGEYLMCGWTDDEALSWALRQVPCGEAQQWKELGLTPAEVAPLCRRGVKPMAVVRDWWRAGIPFDEVADWLGAGLTAREAAEQRARGVTVDQAAALRALRRSDDAAPD